MECSFRSRSPTGSSPSRPHSVSPWRTPGRASGRPRPWSRSPRAAVAAIGIENGPSYTQVRLGPRAALRRRGRRPSRWRPRRRALSGRTGRRPQRRRARLRARRAILATTCHEGLRRPGGRARLPRGARRRPRGNGRRRESPGRRGRRDGCEPTGAPDGGSGRFCAAPTGPVRSWRSGEDREDALVRARRAAQAVRFHIDANPS